jgi:heme exporter protein D
MTDQLNTVKDTQVPYSKIDNICWKFFHLVSRSRNVLFLFSFFPFGIPRNWLSYFNSNASLIVFYSLWNWSNFFPYSIFSFFKYWCSMSILTLIIVWPYSLANHFDILFQSNKKQTARKMKTISHGPLRPVMLKSNFNHDCCAFPWSTLIELVFAEALILNWLLFGSAWKQKCVGG